MMAHVITYSRFTDFDIDLFKSGKHYRLYEKFGSHVMNIDGVEGTYFAVWAPNAEALSVIGNFNDNRSRTMWVNCPQTPDNNFMTLSRFQTFRQHIQPKPKPGTRTGLLSIFVK